MLFELAFIELTQKNGLRNRKSRKRVIPNSDTVKTAYIGESRKEIRDDKALACSMISCRLIISILMGF